MTNLPNEPLTSTAAAFGAARALSSHKLTEENKTEVLQFLSQRPLHTVVMNGFIRDNGLESPLNRGIFCGCRDRMGKLDGVALIGHAMFLEVRSESALEVFAHLAQEAGTTHMIMGEHNVIQKFRKYYSQRGQPPRRVSREVLLALDQSPNTFAVVPHLRLADPDDLAMVMPVHAALAFEESGVDPLLTDPEGFQGRCRRRIEKGRVWVWIEDGQLVFKADVISDTPEVIYLEGVFVNSDERRKGYGTSCLSQLSRQLLRRTRSISVLVSEDRHDAQRFFQSVGFSARALYHTMFLQK